jgi:hypothetical protein
VEAEVRDGVVILSGTVQQAIDDLSFVGGQGQEEPGDADAHRADQRQVAGQERVGPAGDGDDDGE